MEPIYRNCAHLLELAGVRKLTGAFINNGTCTYSLALSGGSVVSSGEMPLVTGAPGLYRAQIPAADLAEITIGAVYVATITFTAPADADNPSGYADERALTFKAARRGSN